MYILDDNQFLYLTFSICFDEVLVKRDKDESFLGNGT
jgi:hypothetical protein